MGAGLAPVQHATNTIKTVTIIYICLFLMFFFLRGLALYVTVAELLYSGNTSCI